MKGGGGCGRVRGYSGRARGSGEARARARLQTGARRLGTRAREAGQARTGPGGLGRALARGGARAETTKTPILRNTVDFVGKVVFLSRRKARGKRIGLDRRARLFWTKVPLGGWLGAQPLCTGVHGGAARGGARAAPGRLGARAPGGGARAHVQDEHARQGGCAHLDKGCRG